MENAKDWNPNLYLKFKSERTQPSLDLVNKIKVSFEPRFIADIGCGLGNSSQTLMNRWPTAHLVGVDNSKNMIEKARTDFPENEWILKDIFSFQYPEKFDIIFSNAAIQWIPDHPQLFRKLKEMLSPQGTIAIQIPLFRDMPTGKAIAEIAMEKQWKKHLEGVTKLFTIYDHFYYYDLISSMFSKVEMWETHYMHVMESHESILEMMRSTGLKPYLERLEDENDKNFLETKVLTAIQKEYPLQKNGKVLFPFKRLFFTASN